MADNGLRVAIVGAGIGGLTLALKLRELGITAKLYEQAPELTEIGAAVGLAANSIRELHRLGLGDALAAVSTEPSELIYRSWRDGHRIFAHPVGLNSWYREHCGAPWYGTHRAELQHVLADGLGPERLHLGCRLVDLVEHPDSIRLQFADGTGADADVVVGADGVRSFVRRWVTGSDDTVYSGTSAFRGIVPIGKLPSLPDPQAIQFWVGPGAHLLHYAIGGGSGDAVNFFAVVDGPATWPIDGRWMADIESGEHLASFEGWHPAVTEMIAAVPHSVRWGLFGVRPLTSWHRGRAVILGDAAHAMLPHHGQGANTTIEDAVVLGQLLADGGPGGLEDAFGQFEGLRRVRTRKIQRSSWVTSDVLHIPDGPGLAARNALFESFPRRFDWIHTYDASQAVASRVVAQPFPA